MINFELTLLLFTYSKTTCGSELVSRKSSPQTSSRASRLGQLPRSLPKLVLTSSQRRARPPLTLCSSRSRPVSSPSSFGSVLSSALSPTPSRKTRLISLTCTWVSCWPSSCSSPAASHTRRHPRLPRSWTTSRTSSRRSARSSVMASFRRRSPQRSCPATLSR